MSFTVVNAPGLAPARLEYARVLKRRHGLSHERVHLDQHQGIQDMVFTEKLCFVDF